MCSACSAARAWHRARHPVQPRRAQTLAQCARPVDSPASAGARARAGLRTTRRLRPALQGSAHCRSDGKAQQSRARRRGRADPRRRAAQSAQSQSAPPGAAAPAVRSRRRRRTACCPSSSRRDALAAGAGAGALAQLSGQRIAGLSPQAARELAFRATGAADTPLWRRLDDRARCGAGVLCAARVARVAADARAARRAAVAYAPYRLTHLAATAPVREVRIDQRRHGRVLRAPRVRPSAARRPARRRKKALVARRPHRPAAERRIRALEHQLDERRQSARPAAPRGRADPDLSGHARARRQHARRRR